MATIHISCVHIQIRLSSGESDTGMGQFWVEWDLPADRDVATFWRHSVGRSVVRSATDHDVEVRSSFAPKRTCCQNKYGIGPVVSWGGGFPTTVCYGAGNNYLCMNVDVMSPGASGYFLFANFKPMLVKKSIIFLSIICLSDTVSPSILKDQGNCFR